MASTYLTRTFGSAGNRQSWTWSAWIKKTKIYGSSSSDREVWFGGYTASNDTDWLEFGTEGNNFYYTTSDISSEGNRLMRDPNAWFHAVVTYDGSNLKFYYNNELDFNNTSLSGNRGINVGGVHTIGAVATNQSSRRFNGLMSHVHFVDGAVLAPTVFGETDSTTGEWKIITSPTVSSYGTNGFFILKDGNSVTDQSPNSNNFTANGTLTKTEDCPSNVFCTINPLVNIDGSYSLSNGNTKFTPTGNNDGTFGTLAAIGGKFYYEVKYAAQVDTIFAGYGPVKLTNNLGTSNPISSMIGQYRNQGLLQIGGSVDTAYTNVTAGDIFAFAIDLEASSGSRTVKAYKNGSLYGTVTIGTAYENDMWIPVCGDTAGANAGRLEFNFGNGYFGSTAVSSAGTNASGNGIFEYDVPTGYTALSTKGLNL